MASPTQRDGVPLGRILLMLSLFAFPAIVYLGVRRLGNFVKIVNIPIVGEWQATGKPWRIVFRPDKTIVSSTNSSQPNDEQAWTSGPGTYSVDYYGTLWVTLGNGKVYSAALAEENPSRFDLIEAETLVPTVFEKLRAAEPKPPEATKVPPPPDSPKELPDGK